MDTDPQPYKKWSLNCWLTQDQRDFENKVHFPLGKKNPRVTEPEPFLGALSRHFSLSRINKYVCDLWKYIDEEKSL